MVDNIVIDYAEFFHLPTLSDFDFYFNWLIIILNCYCVKIYYVYATYTI